MAKGIVGTGEGFDRTAAGKLGGRWHNPSPAERQSLIRKVQRSPRRLLGIYSTEIHYVSCLVRLDFLLRTCFFNRPPPPPQPPF